MLPHLAAIPLQTTTTSNDSGQNLNHLLPVGKNVNAMVVAVSRDQVQPEIFRLKLEINSRLIQMGVFQALPVGQKINVNRQSDGQIQITPQPQQAPAKTENAPQPQANTGKSDPVTTNLPKLTIISGDGSGKIANTGKLMAAVISSRPVYAGAATQTPAGPQGASALINAAQIASNSTTGQPPAPTQATGASPANPPQLNPMLAQQSSILQPGSTQQLNTTPPPQASPIQTPPLPGAQTTTQGPAARPSAPPIHHIVNLTLPDGSKMEVISPKPLPQGAQIQLEKSSAQELQIIRLREPPLTQSSALDKPAIQEVLRNVLPNQIPAGNAFNQLASIAATEAPQAAQISGVVRSMLQLFGVKPGSPEASSQIRNNVEMGGYATERALSKGIAPQPQEMRSQLQQLQQLADRLPEEQRERLEQLLRGIHSRVTSQQLNSLQQWRELPDGGFERVLQFDLPIKQGEHWENLELRLSREGGSNAAGEMVSVWRVRLHFDLEELGGVDAEIRLTDGHEISTLFWCEQPETAERLRQRSAEFSERLRMCGFDSTEINWHEGTAPEQQQVIHKQLVDVHT